MTLKNNTIKIFNYNIPECFMDHVFEFATKTDKFEDISLSLRIEIQNGTTVQLFCLTLSIYIATK